MKFAPLCLVLALIGPAFALRGTKVRRAQDAFEPEALPVAGDVEDAVEDVAEEAVAEEAVAEEYEWQTENPQYDGQVIGGYQVEKEGVQPFPFLAEDGQLYEDASTYDPWVMDNNGMYVAMDRRKSSKGKSPNSKPMNLAPDSLCTNFCQRYLNTCESANHFFNPDSPRGPGTARRRRLEEVKDRYQDKINTRRDLAQGEMDKLFEELNIGEDVRGRVQEIVDNAIDGEDHKDMRRRLIEGTTFAQPRTTGSVYEAREDCEATCMLYPRPINPRDYIGVDEQPGLGAPQVLGDTFWCRDQQLRLAELNRNNYGAQVYCPRASPGGGGFCTNVIFDSSKSRRDELDTPLPNPAARAVNATAYEFLRAGADTGRHLGYCRYYFDDLVADCTNAGIDDRSLPLALAMISPKAQVIILSNNVGKPMPGNPGGPLQGSGITILPNRTFANLLQPTNIQAVIIDDGNIETVEPTAFGALTNVVMISLNNQRITRLFDQNFQSNLVLADVSIVNTDPRKEGKLTFLPDLLFRRNPFLTRVLISGHPLLTTIPTDFFLFFLNGAAVEFKFLVHLDLSNNGLTNTGLRPNEMRDFVILQTFDLSRNNFQTLERAWFDQIAPIDGLPWPIFSLRNIYFHGNLDCTRIEDFALDSVLTLETATMHDLNSIITIPVGLFTLQSGEFRNTLISYTISEAFPSR
ncbi:expressed unknown protein [Seminavis robusta]|uniref:Uncharacterized protein n=1 Tax=Seminavis robusta TaxID=568900 RepID=A0A9N8DUN9_9STRA|nr:expressed unknown protein [Seminavis robusta]|eukprot:Sro370_g128470.1 n/a (690) ;mRNA; r:37552-39692